MKFKTQLTTKLLESNLSGEEINLLPSSYQSLGEVCAIKLNKDLYKYENIIGKAILKLLPKFKTVILQKNISGELRKPEIEIIAGTLPKEIIIHENNCVFYLNPKTIMYSQGNHNEKKRLMKLADNKPEVIVDMFAGIGYFAIPIAKAGPNTKIIAAEKNPDAFGFLEKNIRANYSTNVFPILGDCDNVITKDFPKANRILMGLIPSCKKYIPAAMRIAQKGTTIHYHGLAKEKKEYVLLNDFGNYKVKLLKTTIIKGYKPHVNHVCLDILVI